MNLNQKIQEFKNDFFREFKKKYPNGKLTINSVEVKSTKGKSNGDIDVTIGIITKEHFYEKTYTIHNYERGLDSAIKINDTASRRWKDDNGYLHIRDNVLAKAGVFPYRKCEVKSEFENDDEIVYVCREFEDLERNKDLFANKPIVLTHQWVGKDGENETSLVSGVIGNEIRAEFPYLRGDIIIYDHNLIEKIESGEIVELSPGYECDIIQQEDSYEGESYSFKQLLKNVNHLAVVERGRSGPDLKILDSKPKNIVGETIMKILDFFSSKKHRIEDALKESDLLRIEDAETRSNPEMEKYYSPSKQAILRVVDGKMEIEDEDEDEDEKVEDEDEDEKKTQDSDEKVEDEDVEDEDVEDEDEDDESQKMKDSAIKGLVDYEIRKIERRYQKLNDAYQEVKSVIGNDFNTSNMRVSDIYSHGYLCLTGKKLADGLDAKTAFEIAKNSVTKESKKTFDSELNQNADKVNSLLSIIK